MGNTQGSGVERGVGIGTVMAYGCLISLGILCMVVFATCARPFFAASSVSPTDNETVKPTPSYSAVGDTARLANPGQSAVLLCRTLAINESLTKAVIAKDLYGIGELVASGAAYSVPVGTRVHVIDMQAFVRNVRVLEGKHIGETGWIEPESLAAP